MSAPLTDERLIELIEAYGADPAGWPEPWDEAGRAALMAPGPRLAAVLEAAEGLDRMLAGLAPVDPPAGLAARILETAPAPPPVRRSGRLAGFLSGRALWPAPAALASLVLGLMIGVSLPGDTSGSSDGADAAIHAALGLEDFNSAFGGGQP